MAQVIKRIDKVAGIARTLAYGPVDTGVTAIIFAGTLANIDSTNKSDHKVTLEVLNASSQYSPVLLDVPVPYGGASECPKIVLSAGESLYITSEAANAINAAISLVERS